MVCVPMSNLQVRKRQSFVNKLWDDEASPPAHIIHKMFDRSVLLWPGVLRSAEETQIKLLPLTVLAVCKGLLDLLQLMI